MRTQKLLALTLCALGVVACGGGSGSSGGSSAPPPTPAVPDVAARCAAIIEEAAVTRQELISGSRSVNADLMLRFIHLTDDHIIDDDGQAVIGASLIDPLNPTFESAMRLQEEYSDEVLNDLIGRINTCNAQYPSEFSIITGDSADLTTVAEARRFIDNLDGTFDQPSRFEEKCRAELALENLPEGLKRLRCTRFTGFGVADTQSIDPDPASLLSFFMSDKDT